MGREDGNVSDEVMMQAKWIIAAILAYAFAFDQHLYAEQPSPKPVQLRPIDLQPFQSCIHHWRDIRDSNRFIQVEKDQPAYRADQVREIVDNILLFQRANGGWPKDYDMTAVLTPEQRLQVIATHDRSDTSYDNGNIHSQVEYLAHAITQHDDPQWRTACLKGFDFLIASQYENGGIPQRYPKPDGFHAHITFNDGVMIGVMEVLHNAASDAPHFTWLDQGRKQQARDAVQRGIQCMLKCQIIVDGKKTGWCQQHDEVDFQPRSARTFELASICPQETTEIVHFLMKHSDAKPELRQAVTSAVDWLKSVQLKGIRVEKIQSTKESFLRHDTDIDVVVIQDAEAKPLWARHYEIGTNRPIFAGRDGVKKYSLAEIERERRTGSAWYGGWPRALLTEEYPRWKEKLSAD